MSCYLGELFSKDNLWSRRRWLNSIAILCGAWLGKFSDTDAKDYELSRYEDTLRILLDSILPADDLTPAASTLSVHSQLLAIAQQDATLGRLISQGCGWLEQTYGALSALNTAQIEQLLQAMSVADWESGPRVFFHEIRDRSVQLYYADSRSWAGLAVNRPPQYLGYPAAVEE